MVCRHLEFVWGPTNVSEVTSELFLPTTLQKLPPEVTKVTKKLPVIFRCAKLAPEAIPEVPGRPSGRWPRKKTEVISRAQE